MLQLPDGNIIDMRWKSISYITNDKRVVFSIEPMFIGGDIVCIPKRENCNEEMSIILRNEFIFLLERANWNRDIVLIEMNITPRVYSKDAAIVVEGSMESTVGGKRLEDSHLFNPGSPLSKEQVKELYITIETRFAESMEGDVEIFKNGHLKGRLMNEIIIPILEKNRKVKINYI